MARIALLDLGQVGLALPTLDEASTKLKTLYEGQQRGVGASFGIQSFHLDSTEVANAFRTLSLGRLASGDRAAATAAFQEVCRFGGCARSLPKLAHSFVKEQATVELALGRCPDALVRLGELERAAAAQERRDARWADTLVELATTSIACGSGGDIAGRFRSAISESARLVGLNAGESGASAGEALSRRLAYTLISWSLADPADAVRRDLALDAVLSLKGNLLGLQRDALRLAKAEDVRALNRKLDATYASLARAGAEAVMAEAVNPNQPYRWTDDPWRLRQRADALERERARLAGVDGSSALGIGQRITQRLAPGQPLLEYVRYRPYDFRTAAQGERWGAERYAVFVMQNGKPSNLVDLGPAAAIDALSDAWLDKLQACETCPKRGLVLSKAASTSGTPAHDLYQALLAPVVASIGTARDVYVGADAAIWRVPFAALEDAAGKVLIDQGYVFRYLPASQELARSPNPTPAKSLFVLGAPEFGRKVEGSVFQRFEPLANTRSEAEDLAKLWKTRVPTSDVRLLLGAQASKAALLGASSHGVIHVATHGWFLPSASALRADTKLFLTPEPAMIAPPLVRTGLALSGANQGLEGTVTALELSTLDLRATQLVVLSACETGRGEVSAGEGVFGLSRAFLSDGAETVVSTLWSVGDASTRELMSAYYSRLLRGEDRVTSLYGAARELRGKPGRQDPWFWAGFLPYGRGGPLRL
jgi:CHAT domain-containing protein